MKHSNRVTAFAMWMALATLDSCLTPALAWGPAPDAGLYTGITLDGAYKNVQWVTCGAVKLASGCFDGGNLGPFGRVGAMIQGVAGISGNTVTHAIYVGDVASGTSGKDVALYRYLKTDVITDSSDTITVSLTRTITLPLVGGAKAHSFMAANNGFLFIGTDQGSSVARVQKGPLTVVPVGFPQAYNVSAITADDAGFISVAYGGFAQQFHSDFISFGPDGEGLEQGGQATVVLNSKTAVSTGDLPAAATLTPQSSPQ